jgi:RNA polymerase sigma-70 factor, ECF subfamily
MAGDHDDQGAATAKLVRLVEAARAGDSEAMETLAARALVRARAVTHSLLDPDDAHDVAQDAVIDVLRALSKLREPAAFDGWVTRITARRVLKTRSRTARRGRTVPLDDPGIADTLATTDGSPTAADARELRDALRAAIKSLPREQGVAITLRYLFDCTEGQVADALGKRASATSVLLVRARRTLASHPAIAALGFGDGEGAS